MSGRKHFCFDGLKIENLKKFSSVPPRLPPGKIPPMHKAVTGFTMDNSKTQKLPPPYNYDLESMPSDLIASFDVDFLFGTY